MNKDKWRLSGLFLVAICFLSVCFCETSEASAGTVTSYEKVTWGVSTGRYGVNGNYAFCAEYSKSWPVVGTQIISIAESGNEVLRKVLYYGCNGPANTLGSDAKAHVLTAIAVSDANIGESATGASAKYDVFYWDIVNYPEKYPTPPSTFKAYLAITAGEGTQNLAFYGFVQNGYVTVYKESADVSVTEGNSCYSLQGAQYGIYRSESLAESDKVGTLITDENGKSNAITLEPGTYYACEIAAPKGFVKSSAVVPFSVKSDETTILRFQNEPQVNPIEILLRKVDAETGEAVAQGSASLEGALFTVLFYRGLWEKEVDPATLGMKPDKTWVFKTDANGIIRFEEKYKVSGEPLQRALPLGTVTIQESKASEGYLLNEQVFVVQIASAEIYQVPVVAEEAITVTIEKKQTGTELLISNAVFEHTDPNGKKELLTTDQYGKLNMKGLCYGKHIIREVSAPSGYQLNEETYEFVIDEQTTEQINMTIYNDPILPQTGSCTTLLMTVSGCMLCVIGIYLTKKKEKKYEEI